MDRSDKLFALLVVVGLTAAIFLALGRAGVERSNRAVEIIVDADDVRQLAMAGGVPFSQALNELRTAGATALAVREVTVGESNEYFVEVRSGLSEGEVVLKEAPRTIVVERRPKEKPADREDRGAAKGAPQKAGSEKASEKVSPGGRPAGGERTPGGRGPRPSARPKSP